MDARAELFAELEHPVQRVGAPATPMPYAANMAAAHVPQPAAITAAVRRVTN
jgi:pyruvate/2-oxoglutarate/acetoin dehydrogenase E1 component